MKQSTGNDSDYDDDSYCDVSSYSDDEEDYVTSDDDASADDKKPAATNKEDLAVVVNTEVILDDNYDEEVIDILFEDNERSGSMPTMCMFTMRVGGIWSSSHATSFSSLRPSYL
jgi:hypothetical protein